MSLGGTTLSVRRLPVKVSVRTMALSRKAAGAARTGIPSRQRMRRGCSCSQPLRNRPGGDGVGHAGPSRSHAIQPACWHESDGLHSVCALNRSGERVASRGITPFISGCEPFLTLRR
jgi:hypothetical protein